MEVIHYRDFVIEQLTHAERMFYIYQPFHPNLYLHEDLQFRSSTYNSNGKSNSNLAKFSTYTGLYQNVELAKQTIDRFLEEKTTDGSTVVPS